MKEKDGRTRFTIRDEEGVSPDPLFVADAENLRIEKLSTRITLVAVLIPCLLAAALALAYLDIKSRVSSTQYTGSVGVQNLSKDLESRFSSLSLKQAKIEEQLTEHANALESTGKSLFTLQKTASDFKRISEAKTDRSDWVAFTKKTETAIDTLQREISELNAAFSKFDEELAGQITRMANGLGKDQERLAEIEAQIQRLESEKLTRSAMELALGLERLALQEMVKDRIRELEKKLDLVGKQMERFDQRLAAQSRPPATPPVTGAPPAPSTDSPGIKEQPIN